LIWLKYARLRWKLYLSTAKQFFDSEYLNTWIVLIPASGMIKTCIFLKEEAQTIRSKGRQIPSEEE
jgi:hypothetical protein